MPYSSTYNSTNLPPWLSEIYKNLAERAEQIRREQYTPYQAARIEEIPQDLTTSHQMGRDTGLYMPYLQGAQALTGRASSSFPEEYRQYMNPYQQSVIDKIRTDSMRNFNEGIMPALDAKFVRLGQHGSSRHAQLARNAARDTQSQMLERQAAERSSGYNQARQIFDADQARRLAAASQMANFGTLRQAGHLADIEALGNQGRYIQQQGQVGRDTAYEDFMRQQRFPLERLMYQSAVMHGIPAPLSEFQQAYNRPNTPQTSVGSQIGALAGNLYGARMFGGGQR